MGKPLQQAEDTIHNALVRWSTARVRRPGPRHGGDDSGSEIDRDSCSSGSAATLDSPRSSGSDDSDATSDTGTSRSEAFAPLEYVDWIDDPLQPASSCAQSAAPPQPSAGPSFLDWFLDFRAQLRPYKAAFERERFTTLEALEAMTVDDMAALGLKLGDRRVLVSALEPARAAWKE